MYFCSLFLAPKFKCWNETFFEIFKLFWIFGSPIIKYEAFFGIKWLFKAFLRTLYDILRISIFLSNFDIWPWIDLSWKCENVSNANVAKKKVFAIIMQLFFSRHLFHFSLKAAPKLFKFTALHVYKCDCCDTKMDLS